MGKLSLLVLLVLPALFFSCSKDLKHTNRIHGTWELTQLQQITIEGSSFSTDPAGVFQFDKCQVLEQDFRAFRQHYSYTIGDSTVLKNETGSYKFDEEGRLLIIHIPTDNGREETIYHLISLDKRKLVIDQTQSDNSRTILTLTRK